MVSTKTLNSNPQIGILAGTTGSGKTDLALEIAKDFPIEIINADSVAFYRGMNVGSAKPTLDQQAQNHHHLLDIRNPDEPYTAGDFYNDVKRIAAEVHRRNHRVLIVGGSGFYLKNLLYGIWTNVKADLHLRKKLELETNETLYEQLKQKDPQSLSRVHPNDRYRIIRSLEIIELTGVAPSRLDESLAKTPSEQFKLWVIDRSRDELLKRIEVRSKK